MPVLGLQTDPVVVLLRCPRCAGASASHMPTAAFLREFYRDYRRGREMGVTFGAPDRFGRRLAAALAPHLPRGDLRVLDFGGGDGTLAVATVRALQRRGIADRAEIVVVDLEPPLDHPPGAVPLTWRPTITEALGPFSLVMANAVLEHVPDLGDTVRQLFERMRPGGFLYARTSYVAPLARWWPRVDFGFPAHVHDLGHEFWARARKVFGLSATCLVSRPSPVAFRWRREPLRATAAYVLKLPGRVEARWSAPERERRWWTWVAGWEVLYRSGETPPS